MKQLSGLDAAFLYLETPEMPMHVGGLHIFELPEGYTGDFYEDVKEHVAKRLHLAPIFQRKLELMPFEIANPVWIDDDDVDLDYHVRRIILPKPGTLEQLEAYVARLHSSILDRSRPLWEFYVIEGLPDRKIGFYSKLHHAAMDGAAATAFAKATLDFSPTPRPVKPPRYRRRTNQYQLGIAELMQTAMVNLVTQYAKLAMYLPQTFKTIAGALLPKGTEDGSSILEWIRNFALGPRTSFNVAITNQRLFATASVSLSEVKKIAKTFDVTLNDVVLGMCSGALRRYLDDESYVESAIPAKPLIAAVPVSLREAGNQESNNQVTMAFCSLGTHLADPLARLKEIHESTSTAKESVGALKAVVPTDFPILGSPWLLSVLGSLYGRSRLANSIRPLANVVISNVPGSPVPLYLAGAKMLTHFPVSIVGHGLGLNITVQSYCNQLDFGFIACRRAVPDLKDLAAYLVESFQELKTLAEQVDSDASEKRSESPSRASKPAPSRIAAATTPPARSRSGVRLPGATRTSRRVKKAVSK